MKTLLRIVFIASLVFSVACNNQKKSDEYSIPPLTVEIPDELKDQPEIVEFIRDSEKSINHFAESVERVYIENPQLIGKDADEMSMVEKLKVLKVAGEMAVAFGEFSLSYANMNEKMNQFETEMTEDQALALATVGDAFEKRMELLEQRLEKLGVN